VVPSFTRQFELRWASGGPPGSAQTSAGYSGWARFREYRRGLGPAWVAALVDAWPAPVLSMLPEFGIASSLNWAIDFVEPIEDEPRAASDDWWAFAVETDLAAGGWAHTRARLWSPSGRLVATSSQTVAVFA
jgi:acyl-CoA thioesterase